MPEMMTAVAITLIMLAASGMIFTSASRTSGKAMALNDIMKQARAITSQLDSDFAGYRDDLPVAVLFEGLPFGVDSNLDGVIESTIIERNDRIVFFADGDFQDMSLYSNGNTNRSSLARILYSQTGDASPNKNTDGLNLAATYSGVTGAQRALCRRMKMMTYYKTISPLNSWNVNPVIGGGHYFFDSWLGYDLEPFEYGPERLWKQATIQDYNMWLTEGYIYGISFVRRPNFGDVYDQYIAGGDNTLQSYRAMNQYKQKSCMVLDCTDFNIQVWVKPPGENNYRWFPTNWDLAAISDNLGYWNFIGMTSGVPCIGIGWNLNPNMKAPFPSYGKYDYNPYDAIPAPSSADKQLWPNTAFLDPSTGLLAPPLEKPKAYRFSFKLYDESRTHFPQGKEFTYIIDVRDKE